MVVALALGFYSTSLKSRAGQIKEQSHFRLLLTLSMVSRGTGGIAIILGIAALVVDAVTGKLPSFSSAAGVALLIGIVLAFVAYGGFGEGMLMRGIRALRRSEPSGYAREIGRIRAYSWAMAITALITLVLMAVSAV